MGNHSVGRAMVAVALTASDRRRPGEKAIDILDLAAEASEIRGMDAEFDDATDPDEPFGKLLIEAFCPEFIFPARDDDDDIEEHWDAFYERVYTPFRQRYGLC